MKYLAVFLGVLSAASAHSAGKYKYVPETLQITVYSQEHLYGDIIPRTTSDVSLDNPQMKVKLNRLNDSGAEIPIAYNGTTVKAAPSEFATIGPSKSKTLLRFTPWTFGWVTAIPENPFITGTTAEILFGDQPLKWPTTPNRQEQELTVQCAVPEYFTSDNPNLSWALTEMTMFLVNDNYGSGITAFGMCYYRLRPVPDINIEIKNENMHISGVSGTTTIASNQLIATGWGGGMPATMRIENPFKEDISVSFSQTDFDQTTTTITPTQTGAQTDFYVKVNNTKPGSREYRVNFTAQFE